MACPPADKSHCTCQPRCQTADRFRNPCQVRDHALFRRLVDVGMSPAPSVSLSFSRSLTRSLSLSLSLSRRVLTEHCACKQVRDHALFRRLADVEMSRHSFTRRFRRRFRRRRLPADEVGRHTLSLFADRGFCLRAGAGPRVFQKTCG